MKKPFLLGLTGSIGMGKSTTAAMFRDLGVPVWDADEVVHALYEKGGAAVDPVSALVPKALRDGKIDRTVLADWLGNDAARYALLEKIVHPLVAADRKAFVDRADAPLVVLDIPLFFEIGAEDTVDAIAVVSTSESNQRKRVLQRPGMTLERFQTILDRQIPDATKRKRATYIIDTTTLESARSAVEAIVENIRNPKDA